MIFNYYDSDDDQSNTEIFHVFLSLDKFSLVFPRKELKNNYFYFYYYYYYFYFLNELYYCVEIQRGRSRPQTSGLVHKLSQLNGHSEARHPEHASILHTGDQRSCGGKDRDRLDRPKGIRAAREEAGEHR